MSEHRWIVNLNLPLITFDKWILVTNVISHSYYLSGWSNIAVKECKMKPLWRNLRDFSWLVCAWLIHQMGNRERLGKLVCDIVMFHKYMYIGVPFNHKITSLHRPRTVKYPYIVAKEFTADCLSKIFKWSIYVVLSFVVTQFCLLWNSMYITWSKFVRHDYTSAQIVVMYILTNPLYFLSLFHFLHRHACALELFVLSLLVTDINQ